MNKNKVESISKIARGMYKERFQTLMLPISFFAIFCFISLALGIVAPISLIFTIPFLVIPSLFALSAVGTIAGKKAGLEGAGFFLMFRGYFSGFFKGSYRVIIGFLKALLVALLVSIVLTPILSYTVLANDSAFIALENSLENPTDVNVILDEYLNFIQTSGTFRNIMFAINIASFFGGMMMFLHHFSRNAVKSYHNFLSPTPIPMPDLNLIHKVTYKKIKKEFNKDFYSSLWALILLVAIGFVGFACIGNFVLTELVTDQVIVVGLFGVFVVTLFFLPYYFNVLQLLYQKYSRDYVETFIELSLQSIEEIKKTTEIDPEKEKQIREFLDAQKKKIDEKKDEENK